MSACIDKPDAQFGGPSSDDSSSSGTAGRIEGHVTDEGFGSSLLSDGQTIWIGAPHADGGRVYVIDISAGSSTADPSELLLGTGRTGSSLALIEGALIAGAPLYDTDSGGVLDSTGALLLSSAPMMGLALLGTSAADPRWWAADSGGVTGSDGSVLAPPDRPSALARLQIDGETWIGVGMARAESPALWIRSDADVSLTWSHPEPYDRAGFALATGDLDGDGQSEWIVGAPGADRIYLVAADLSSYSTLTSPLDPGARFGAALSVADVTGDGIDDLLVGAPGHGDTHQGAIILYTETELDTPALISAGDSDDAQLGAAVVLTTDQILAGAPGGSGETGEVWIIAAP